MLEKSENAGATTYIIKTPLTAMLIPMTFLVAAGMFGLYFGWNMYAAAGNDLAHQGMAFEEMTGGVGFLAILFYLVYVMIRTNRNGGVRLVLTKDKVTFARGDRAIWAAWDSVDPFERQTRYVGYAMRQRKDRFFGAKIAGSHIDAETARRADPIFVCARLTKDDMPVLIRALNRQRAEALGTAYDDAPTAALAAEFREQAKMFYKLRWFAGTFPLGLVAGVCVSRFIAVRFHAHHAKAYILATLVLSFVAALLVARIKGAKKYPEG